MHTLQVNVTIQLAHSFAGSLGRSEYINLCYSKSSEHFLSIFRPSVDVDSTFCFYFVVSESHLTKQKEHSVLARCNRTSVPDFSFIC